MNIQFKLIYNYGSTLYTSDVVPLRFSRAIQINTNHADGRILLCLINAYLHDTVFVVYGSYLGDIHVRFQIFFKHAITLKMHPNSRSIKSYLKIECKKLREFQNQDNIFYFLCVKIH